MLHVTIATLQWCYIILFILKGRILCVKAKLNSWNINIELCNSTPNPQIQSMIAESDQLNIAFIWVSHQSQSEKLINLKDLLTFLSSLLVCSSEKRWINYINRFVNVKVMMKPVSFPTYFSYVFKDVHHMRVPLKGHHNTEQY